MKEKKTFEEFLSKIEELKEEGGVDLSAAEDMSIAVMNLVSLEEHFFFTAEKTGKSGYLDGMEEVRSVRKDLLRKLMPENEGESWCISKHLLSAAMRLVEVGSKLRAAATEGVRDEARLKESEEMFDKAYRLYSIFWAVKLGIVKGGEAKPKGKDSKLEELVNKLADCCNE